MDETSEATLKRLAKRLSALRVTLDQGERAMLDRIVLGQAVQSNRALAKTYAGKRSRKAAPEVHGHALPNPGPLTTVPNADGLLEFDSTTGGYRPSDLR